jgi:MFS family permease
MCVLIAVNQLGFGGIVPVLALYARSFSVPQSAIGVAIAVYGLARFLLAIPAGRLADGLGRRPALALGGLVHWIKRYVFFHDKRHPAEMGAAEVSAFLTSLAVDSKVAASTQNQALPQLHLAGVPHATAAGR